MKKTAGQTASFNKIIPQNPENSGEVK